MFLGMSKVMRTAVPSVLGLGEWQITWVCHDNHDDDDHDGGDDYNDDDVSSVVGQIRSLNKLFSGEFDTEMIQDLTTSFYRTERAFKMFSASFNIDHLTFNII